MREDYVERQIEQLGKVLRGLLIKLSGGGLGPDLETEASIEIAGQEFSENLFDPEYIKNIDWNSSLDNASWNSENEELLIRIWIEKAKTSNENEKKQFLEAATELLKVIAKKRATISLPLYQLQNEMLQLTHQSHQS